jgi:hypothetical protein
MTDIYDRVNRDQVASEPIDEHDALEHPCPGCGKPCHCEYAPLCAHECIEGGGEPTRTHSLERTSIVGRNFLGTCVLCGQRNLTLADSLKPCPNPSGVTEDQAVVNALDAPASEPRKIKDLSDQIGFNDGMDDEPTPSEKSFCRYCDSTAPDIRHSLDGVLTCGNDGFHNRMLTRAEAEKMVREEIAAQREVREACVRDAVREAVADIREQAQLEQEHQVAEAVREAEKELVKKAAREVGWSDVGFNKPHIEIAIMVQSMSAKAVREARLEIREEVNLCTCGLYLAKRAIWAENPHDESCPAIAFDIRARETDGR